MKLSKALFFTLLLMPIFTSQAWPLSEVTYQVVATDNYHPYSYYDEEQAEGLYHDIVREIAARSGYSISINLWPVKRQLRAIAQNKATIAVGVLYSKQRANYMQYLLDIPLVDITHSVFVAEDSGVTSADFAGLQNKIVGYKRGFLVSKAFIQARTTGLFSGYPVEDAEQLLKMLLQKRVDAFCHSTANTMYFIEKLGLSGSIRNYPIQSTASTTYIAISKPALEDLPSDFITKFSASYQRMIKDGTLKAIYNKHGIKPPRSLTLNE